MKKILIIIFAFFATNCFSQSSNLIFSAGNLTIAEVNGKFRTNLKQLQGFVYDSTANPKTFTFNSGNTVRTVFWQHFNSVSLDGTPLAITIPSALATALSGYIQNYTTGGGGGSGTPISDSNFIKISNIKLDTTNIRLARKLDSLYSSSIRLENKQGGFSDSFFIKQTRDSIRVVIINTQKSLDSLSKIIKDNRDSSTYNFSKLSKVNLDSIQAISKRIEVQDSSKLSRKLITLNNDSTTLSRKLITVSNQISDSNYLKKINTNIDSIRFTTGQVGESPNVFGNKIMAKNDNGEMEFLASNQGVLYTRDELAYRVADSTNKILRDSIDRKLRSIDSFNNLILTAVNAQNVLVNGVSATGQMMYGRDLMTGAQPLEVYELDDLGSNNGGSTSSKYTLPFAFDFIGQKIRPLSVGNPTTNQPSAGSGHNPLYIGGWSVGNNAITGLQVDEDGVLATSEINASTVAQCVGDQTLFPIKQLLIGAKNFNTNQMTHLLTENGNLKVMDLATRLTSRTPYQAGLGNHFTIGGWDSANNRTVTLATSALGGALTAGRYNLVQPTTTNGQLQELQVDANGNLRTTSPSEASTIAGTAPSKMQVVGGVFNTTLPSLTNGQSVGVQLDANGRQLVNTSINGTGTQVNSFLTAGGVAQIALALNTNRTGFEIINTSAATLWINISGPATTTSIPIPPGQPYSRYTGKIFTNAISIIGATTGQTFTTLESN
jgi:hypothetical protein